MELLRFVVVIFLFKDTSGEDFIISDVKTDWKTASTNCTLATPDVVPSSGITAQIDGVTADIWVGYYRTRTALEYFGCTEKGNSKPRFTTRADPGQCMSACGTQKIIGIYGNECFCFHNDEIKNRPTMSHHCKLECKNHTGIVCGGHTDENKGTTYISLYRFIGTNIAFGKDGGRKNCLYYDKSGFTWDTCSLEYLTVCENGTTAWIENPMVSSNWITSTTKCFEKKARPSTFEKTMSLSINQTSPQLWTGMVRSHVIYTLGNGLSHLNNKSKYGYIHTGKNGYTALKFDFFNATKKFLCVNVRSGDGNSTGGSSDVGAIVGAVLSIVVVIAVIIGVVLYLRKRDIQLPFLKKGEKTQTPRKGHNNVGYAISQPAIITQNMYESDRNEYAEIDLTTSENEANNGVQNGATCSDTSDYAHDYFTLEKVEEAPYDSTKSEDKNSDPITFNPYNKLSIERSSNYDHIGVRVGHAGRKVSDSENTYNTTSIRDSCMKTSLREPNGADNMTEDTEDTYNHTNSPRHQTDLRASENDYSSI